MNDSPVRAARPCVRRSAAHGAFRAAEAEKPEHILHAAHPELRKIRDENFNIAFNAAQLPQLELLSDGGRTFLVQIMVKVK